VRSRVFFFLASLAFGLVAAGGVALALTHGQAHDLGAVLMAGAASLAFAGVAWVESPAPRHACRACGGPTLLGMGFCTSCGSSSGEPRSR
jgi:hypothetical protein